MGDGKCRNIRKTSILLELIYKSNVIPTQPQEDLNIEFDITMTKFLWDVYIKDKIVLEGRILGRKGRCSGLKGKRQMD